MREYSHLGKHCDGYLSTWLVCRHRAKRYTGQSYDFHNVYPTTTTHRLCCSGSAAGIVFGAFYLVYVIDPVLNLCDRCYYGTLLLLLQAAAAVRVSFTTSREGSSSTTAVIGWFLMLSSFAYTTHSAVYLAAQISVVGTPLRTRKRTKKGRSGPKSSGSGGATFAVKRATIRAVGSYCRPFGYTTHTAVYLAAQKLRCRHCYTQIDYSNRFKQSVI